MSKYKMPTSRSLDTGDFEVLIIRIKAEIWLEGGGFRRTAGIVGMKNIFKDKT